MKGDSALVCKHRDERGGKLRARLPSELLRGREHDATTSCGGGARHMFDRINAKADPAETTNVAAQHPDIVAKRAALRREPHVPMKLCPIRVLDADRSSSPRRFLHFETTAPGATSIEGTFSDILAFPRSLLGSEPWGFWIFAPLAVMAGRACGGAQLGQKHGAGQTAVGLTAEIR